MVIYEVDGVEYAVIHETPRKCTGIRDVTRNQRILLQTENGDVPLGNLFLNVKGDAVVATTVSGRTFRPGNARDLIRDWKRTHKFQPYRETAPCVCGGRITLSSGECSAHCASPEVWGA